MLSQKDRQKFKNYFNRYGITIDDVIRDPRRTTWLPAFTSADDSVKGLELQRFCKRIMKKVAAAALDVARLLHTRYGGNCITASLGQNFNHLS